MPPRVDARRGARAARGARGRPRGGRAGRVVGESEPSVGPQTSGVHLDPPVDFVAGEEIDQDQAVAQQGIELQSRLFDRFLKRDPPKFYGVSSPVVAIEFLRDLETIFEPMGIEGEMRVRFATYRLHEGARDWWSTLRLSLAARGEIPISWERFVGLFRENYCLSTHMTTLERELILMAQGTLSVEEYERRFSELCRLLPAVHPTEEQRVTRFRDGLRWEIRHRVSLFPFSSMHELRNAALRVEMELAEPEARGAKRGRQETFSAGGPSSSRFQRGAFQPTRPGQSHFSAPVRPSYSTASTAPRLPVRSGGFQRDIAGVSSGDRCFRCNRVGHRARECGEREIICYRCQQPGHLSRECPQSLRVGGTGTTSFAQSSRGSYQGAGGSRGSVAGTSQSGAGRGQMYAATQQEVQDPPES